jgi:hypothetical protein
LFEQPAGEEKLGLRGVPEQLQLNFARPLQKQTEVDMGRDIAQTRPPERVRMRAMAIVTIERARSTLRMVELPGRAPRLRRSPTERSQAPACSPTSEQ